VTVLLQRVKKEDSESHNLLPYYCFMIKILGRA